MKNLRNVTVSISILYIIISLMFVFLSAVPSYAADECSKSYPAPVLQNYSIDSSGRVKIPVANRTSYDNALFRNVPELPSCSGASGAYSTRTYVDIYDGTTDQYIYGFCAFQSPSSLADIWFPSKDAIFGKVYIKLKDRLCNKEYKSNILNWHK
ncbi:MAG: hypothetical protein JW943_01870 [Deltaproteobacteria bacterium]|nr:hypothetical protein [Deltaproteobacteria bacterium]